MNITGVMMFCWEAPSPTDLGLSSITLFALHNGRRPESEECAALIVTINDRSVVRRERLPQFQWRGALKYTHGLRTNHNAGI